MIAYYSHTYTKFNQNVMKNDKFERFLNSLYYTYRSYILLEVLRISPSEYHLDFRTVYV